MVVIVKLSYYTKLAQEFPKWRILKKESCFFLIEFETNDVSDVNKTHTS